MSEPKEKLRHILNDLPLDKREREVMENSLRIMSDKEAEEIVTNLKPALAALPEALDRLEKALAKYESQKQGDEDGKTR
jgi:hypothetical protein